MGWRRILEAEHRLMLEVADAADKECEHITATGTVRADLVGDILGFLRFFLEFTRGQIVIRDGKDNKDRVTPLPRVLKPALDDRLCSARAVHERDLAEG